MPVTEEQVEAPLTAKIVPPTGWISHVVGLVFPFPVALNNFGGRLDADFRTFDRSVLRAAERTTNHFDLEKVDGEFRQVTVAILKVAIRAIDTPRGERPEVPSVRWATESLIPFVNIEVQGTIGCRGENIILPVLAAG